MHDKLPTWIWTGAFVLAGIAGMVNVVGFLGFEHQAITHLTGTTSLLSAATVAGDGRSIGALLGVIGAFVGGAVISGLIIQDSTLQLGRRYGVVLVLESLLLVVAVPLFQHGWLLGPFCAAMACGLQNAMATTYSGAVIRTSHLSGMFTDLGIMLGHAIRGLPVAHRRLGLCLVIITGFFLGGMAGALLFGVLRYSALYLPAALTGLVGLGYTTYRHLMPNDGNDTP